MPKQPPAELFTKRHHSWTSDEQRALEEVHPHLAGSGIARYARAFEYICKNQGDYQVDGPLHTEKVKRAAGLSDKQLTELRQRVAYHSARIPTVECPFVVVIEPAICRIRMIPKGDKATFHLGDLADLERPEPEGHLDRNGEIVIYSHQAIGLPPSLLKQMLRNMEQGVTYRYFMPESYAAHVVDLALAFLCHEPASLKSTLQTLRERFEVNIIPRPLPVIFSIHNASSEHTAMMFVRSPASSKELTSYGDHRWAYDKYLELMDFWKPRERSKESPIVLPCRGLRLQADLRSKLEREVSRRDFPTLPPDLSAEEIVRHLLGGNHQRRRTAYR